MSSDQTAPERGIGATAALANVNNIDMVLITPAENKSIPDSALKTLNLWGQPGHVNRHQRDASRLLVKYLKSRGNRPVIERVWPEDA